MNIRKRRTGHSTLRITFSTPNITETWQVAGDHSLPSTLEPAQLLKPPTRVWKWSAKCRGFSVITIQTPWKRDFWATIFIYIYIPRYTLPNLTWNCMLFLRSPNMNLWCGLKWIVFPSKSCNYFLKIKSLQDWHGTQRRPKLNPNCTLKQPTWILNKSSQSDLQPWRVIWNITWNPSGF